MAKRSSQGARNLRHRLREVTRAIRQRPHLGQIADARSVRRVVLRPYPYLLFYSIAASEIVVLALRHGARDPSTMPGEAADDLP